MKIWLDDTRDPVESLPFQGWFREDPDADAADWTWMRTAREVIAWLEAGVQVTEVSLDHDLGDPELVGEGEDVLDWIDEQVVTTEDYEPPVIHIHSGNAPAHDQMDRTVEAIARHLAERKARQEGT